MFMKKQYVSKKIGDSQWPLQKIKPMKVNELQDTTQKPLGKRSILQKMKAHPRMCMKTQHVSEEIRNSPWPSQNVKSMKVNKLQETTRKRLREK
jgi:hypothetical protein